MNYQTQCHSNQVTTHLQPLILPISQHFLCLDWVCILIAIHCYCCCCEYCHFHTSLMLKYGIYWISIGFHLLMVCILTTVCLNFVLAQSFLFTFWTHRMKEIYLHRQFTCNSHLIK
jgi:hypothetical protein